MEEIDLSKHNSGLKLIPEFDGSNWDEFKRKIEMQFTIMGLETFLHHPPSSRNMVDIRNDKLASVQICLRLTQSQYKQVSTCSTASDIWSKLKSVYEQSTESRASSIFIQFIHLQKTTSETMKTYLDKITGLYHDLKVHDIEIGEVALCAKTLDGLPETFQQIKAAARASSGMTMSRLTNLLLSTERDGQYDSKITHQQNEFKNLNTETRSMVLRPNRYDHKYHNNMKRKYCSRCKNSTHNSSECWFLNKQNPRKGHNSANNAISVERDDKSELFTGFHTQIGRQTGRRPYLIDSGANVSMTNDQSILQDFHKIHTPIDVMCSNGARIPAHGSGRLKISSNPAIILENVLFVPSLTKTLLATKSFTEQGLTILIDQNFQIMDKAGKVLITSEERNGLHYIDVQPSKEANMSIELDLAHRRFGHASDERLLRLESATNGITITNKERTFCDECAQGKSRRQPFPSERQTKSSRPYEIVCSDIKGPFLVPSKEGFRYYISFNCLYSTWTQIKLLRTKAAEEVLEATKWFITNAQAETKQRLATFLTDNGTEYVNRQLSTYLIQKNIKHLRTIPYSPQQNGQAERKNQTIMAITRCILIESRLPYNYWSFAVHHAVYTMNRLPTKRIEWQTPYELWQGNKPDVHHLRPFGCIAYAHLESSLRTSLQPTARKCIFLGYAPNQKGYIVQDIQNQVILARRDVTFNEQ